MGTGGAIGEASGSWSAAGTAVTEREEAARHALGGTHLPWDLHLTDPTTYACELAWHTMGDATLVECRSDPVTGRRGRTELRRTDVDTAAVLLVLAGRERVRQEGVAVELAAGDALLWCSASPVDFEVIEPLHKMTMLVPADRLAALRPRGGVGPAAMPGGHGPVRLLGGHLQALATAAPDLSPIDRLFAVDVALDLLIRAITPSPVVAGPAATSGGALLQAAVGIIARELGDPDLTPARLARRLGITPRYLHMVFAATGETVGAYIRRRRLDRVRRDLADPRSQEETITTIAFRWGFTDSGHLSRSFRGQHGMSPTAYRAQAHRRLASVAGEEPCTSQDQRGASCSTGHRDRGLAGGVAHDRGGDGGEGGGLYGE